MKKILIIEDDAFLLGQMVAKFRVVGFEVASFDGSGEIEQVTHHILTEKPDYIVLDIVLPNISGYDLLHSIKGHEDVCDIPLIIFSDFSEEDVRRRCHNLGADFYFIKQDFSIDDFVAKVGRIIKNRKKN